MHLYAFNILVVSDGMYSINLRGLQPDLNGGVWGGGAPPEKKEVIKYIRPKLSYCLELGKVRLGKVHVYEYMTISMNTPLTFSTFVKHVDFSTCQH